MKSVLSLCGIFIALVLCSGRCESDEPCPEDIICSMVFKSISIEIVDRQGEHVGLSKAELRSEYLNNPIDIITDSATGMPYQIINDGHMKFLNHQQARTFVFKGWINDSLVVNEPYKIRHDCCHVLLQSGPEKIIIDHQTPE